jgi:hypothetical protein
MAAAPNMEMKVHHLWRLALILPIIGFSLSFILHQATGHARVWLPFISETDHAGPEAWPFKIGLVSTGIVNIILSWKLWEMMKLRSQEIHWSTNVSLYAGITCGVGAIGVASLRWTLYQDGHIVAAILAFIGGLCWGIFMDISSKKLKMNEQGIKIRKYAIPIAAISLLSMTIAFRLGMYRSADIHKTLDLDLAHTEMLFSAAFEWILFAAFMTVLYSFRWDVTPLPSIPSETEP